MKNSSLPEQMPYEIREIDSNLLKETRTRFKAYEIETRHHAKQGSRDSIYPLTITVKFRDRSSVDEFSKRVRQSLTQDVKEFVYSKDAKEPASHGFYGRMKRAPKSDENGGAWRTAWTEANMPEFTQDEAKWEYFRTKVIIQSLEDHISFAHIVRQYLTPKTKSIYFPQWTPANLKDKKWISDLPQSKKRPSYPIFIISRGRAYSRYTAKSLDELDVPYYMVVEPREHDDYAHFINPEKILTLPFDTDPERPTGPGRARNWCLDYARDVLKTKRHWCMDDNINGFYRLHKNRRYKIGDGAMFRACEDFVDRYENVPIAGLQYRFFCAPKSSYPAFVTNTRIYSALLIENKIKHRWRGRYNEDTILSLDVLSDGDCTIQFNSLLQGKMGTQALKGGNTDIFYHNEEIESFLDRDRYNTMGTLNKSVYLKQEYPELTEVVWKFGRVHHEVDYSSFKANKPRLIKNPKPLKDYKMRLVDMSETEKRIQDEQISNEQ